MTAWRQVTAVMQAADIPAGPLARNFARILSVGLLLCHVKIYYTQGCIGQGDVSG